MRAYSPSEIENLNIPELPLDGEWEAAFGRPLPLRALVHRRRVGQR